MERGRRKGRGTASSAREHEQGPAPEGNRALTLRGEGYSPAAFRSASTRSVRSHVKSGISRPKWPYAAVWA